jgi:hypothetical protein
MDGAAGEGAEQGTQGWWCPLQRHQQHASPERWCHRAAKAPSYQIENHSSKTGGNWAAIVCSATNGEKNRPYDGVVAAHLELLRVEVPPGRALGVPAFLGDPKTPAKRRTISTSRAPRRGRRWGSYGSWQLEMKRAVAPPKSVAVEARLGAD